MIGLYVHIPFCAARCRYCDFPTAPYEEAAARRYLRALEREAEAAADYVGPLRADTLYLGGGTPPVLRGEQLGQLLAEVPGRFEVSPEAEATCEANPESLTAEILEALAAAGFNRLSLGLQTFDDGLLRLLGRRHDASGAEEAYWQARAAGVENVSLDLMYGLPGQKQAAWDRDLARALALKPEHISLYALTLEPTVELYRRRAAYVFPADDEQAEMYYAAAEALAAAGYRQYELSNFARPGRECRHNLRYWQDGEYLGFGPGAASHWRGGRYRNPRELDEYVAAAATGRWPLVDAEPSDPYREIRTAAVLALRLTEGLDAAAFAERYGVNPLEYYREELAPLAAAGLVTVDGDRLRLSPKGRFLADEVFAALI
ncbi:MAG: radical SAM family heme chaperone HemW [Candidatus Coatesbacteria bacterium]|nr:MAG: radical SAM family heme chaperone HemW [Candidatus Coatesbacteria bacterium]